MNARRFTCILATCLALAVLAASTSQTAEARIDKLTTQESISEYMMRMLSEDSIPGSAAVVVNNQQTIYAKGFGITSTKNPLPVDKFTVFDLASVSKSFTALGVMLLRDKGCIELDSPVVKYLPDFNLSKEDLSDEITVRHLLTHTSGIPGALAEPQGYFNGPTAMGKMVADLKGLKLNNPPGEAFEYSNLNYFLLGALVEAVSAMPFERYMADNVFEPLGLEHTTLYPQQAEAWGRAYGHQPVFGQVVERSMPFYRSAAPAGWVMSNAVDMGRWLRLFLNRGMIDGEKLVRPETIDEMLSPAVYFEKEGCLTGYGMGWLIATDSNGIKRIWHGGDTPSFLADMMLLPEYGIGVTVMVNSQTGTHGHQIAPGIAGIYLGTELEQMASPWWAYWKTIDSFSFGGLSLCVVLITGLGLFIWRIALKLRRRHYVFARPRIPAKWLPARQVILFITPAVLMSSLVLSGYLTFDFMYGYNLFAVMAKTMLAIPPSTWAAGMAVIALVALWSLTLALVPLVIRQSQANSRR
ncbi:MAG: beta-lactamase family protein [Dehalococcoidaceae bacterium]|nr:beta-lactamase family protein [Dehalococcoidaceae bacterium]